MRVFKAATGEACAQLPPVITSDCKYHHNPTSSPVPQTHERKAMPVNSESSCTDNPVRPPATPPAKTYILPKTSPCSLNLQVELTSPTSLTSITTSALLDSGATGMFINWDFMWRHRLETTPLPQPVLLHNVDGSTNEHGSIMEEVHTLLCFRQHSERAQFAVTNLGQQSVIIGHPWLLHHNLEVDWTAQKVSMTHCLTGCNGQVLNLELPLEPGDAVYAILLTLEWEERICATLTPSQRLAEEAQAQQVHPPESAIPERYKDFADVFSEEAFAHLPPCKAWDHAIELHPNAKLPRGGMFPLSPAEQKELDTFLRENLANKRIHPSKSPIGAPVFFVKKKEGSLCLVQDYQKLNKITVKNSYPLPLVSDVLTRLCDAESFTTLDLRWGFNNVRLKEGDEWKAAFSMNCGLFEPLVMFFGLCNSPATFQTMMNDILHPFIDRNEAVCYMDDILIYSASLADHQRITQEILQTLRSYNLFLRLE